MHISNQPFWDWMSFMDVSFDHHVRPLKSMSQLNIPADTWHPELSFKFRYYMGTILFFNAVILWHLKYPKRDLNMARTLWHV